jgi:hypothetical protein
MQLARPHWRALSIDWRRLTAMLLALVGLIAAALAWIAYSYAARSEPLVVAATAIEPGARLTPDMLTVIEAPLIRPEALRGLPDPAQLIGTYARVQLSAGQVLRADLVQPAPLDLHIYTNDPLPAEALRDNVFELALTGITSVNAQDRVNILVLVDAENGNLSTFSAGQMDVPGSGSRVVRVLANLNVLHVDEKAAYLNVTHAQSQYLWTLAAAKIPFVGEIATMPDAPLGPLRAGDASLAFLRMSNLTTGGPIATPALLPATPAPTSATPTSPALPAQTNNVEE